MRAKIVLLKRLFPFSIRDFLVTTVIFFCATGVCALLQHVNSIDGFAFPVFVLAVLLVSRLTTGYLFGFLASVLGVVCTNFIFTYPYWAVNFTLSGYPTTFLVFLVVSIITCALTTQVRQQERLRAEGEKEKMRANLLRSVSHDIRSISAIDNFISINNAVDIDLFGQVNAESAGIKHISGAGGQLDFVLGAYLSNGGKSFICLSSTFMNKKTGKLESRIRPTLENGSIVTDTRANVHYLCTEYGCVNLKGLTSWEKAEALISVAHPDFRDELIAEAEKLHIWRRSNKR